MNVVLRKIFRSGILRNGSTCTTGARTNRVAFRVGSRGWDRHNRYMKINITLSRPQVLLHSSYKVKDTASANQWHIICL